MRKVSIAEALREALREEMQRDPSVFVIGEDVGVEGGFGGAFTVTLGLSQEFGHERVLDTPISEIGLVGAAVGAAVVGMRPVVDIQYADFFFCAMDQITNQAAKLRYMSGGKIKVPLVLMGAVGASTRGAQHAQCVEGWFTHTPGLKVVTPSTAYDAKGLLKSAIRDDNPVLFLGHKLLYGSKGVRKEPGALDVMDEIPEEEYLVPLGVAAIRREGSDITVVANLLMVHRALEAARELESEGISIEVIDPRTLVPMDTDTISKSVQKTGRLIIVEEDNKRGGWGAELAAYIAEEVISYLDGPIIRVAAPDTPVPFSPIMERYYVPDERNIIEAIRKLLS